MLPGLCSVPHMRAAVDRNLFSNHRIVVDNIIAGAGAIIITIYVHRRMWIGGWEGVVIVTVCHRHCIRTVASGIEYRVDGVNW